MPPCTGPSSRAATASLMPDRAATSRAAIAALLLIAAPGLLVQAPGSGAAPGGADLAVACETALAEGFDGIHGRMCIWYVTACDCASGGAIELPRVCLPADAEIEALAAAVLQGLHEDPELLVADAALAAATVLSGIYPCVD
jgi:hypothetical protein